VLNQDNMLTVSKYQGSILGRINS